MTRFAPVSASHTFHRTLVAHHRKLDCSTSWRNGPARFRLVSRCAGSEKWNPNNQGVKQVSEFFWKLCDPKKQCFFFRVGVSSNNLYETLKGNILMELLQFIPSLIQRYKYQHPRCPMQISKCWWVAQVFVLRSCVLAKAPLGSKHCPCIQKPSRPLESDFRVENDINATTWTHKDSSSDNANAAKTSSELEFTPPCKHATLQAYGIAWNGFKELLCCAWMALFPLRS